MTLKAIPGGDGVPPEPDWSTTYTDELDLAAAHDAWGLVVRELQEAGVLSTANGHSIERLVNFRIIYARSVRAVEDGIVLKASKTRVPMVSLHWVIMKQAADALQSIEAELGLAPVRRGKTTKVAKKTTVQRAADAYISVKK